MIALASDHGGYELKQKVIGYLEANGYTCHDFGCYSLESCDYPEFGRAAAEAVAKGECEKGIVISALFEWYKDVSGLYEKDEIEEIQREE